MNNFENKNIFYLIPKEALDEFIEAIQDIRRIQAMLEENNSAGALGDYVPEEDAMKLLGRGKTWFWNKRKSGELPGKKAAGRWYYRKEDIKRYIQNG